MQKKKNPHIEPEVSIENAESQQRKRSVKVKKTFTIIAIVLGSILLLFGGIVGALHIKGVQTFIVGKVTDKLSKELNVDADIVAFHYRPLSHLVIDSVYLSDQQKDTLAFIEQLQLDFAPLALRNQRINIQQLRLQKPYINLQSTSDSTLNIQFLIEAFKRDTVNFPFRVNIDQLELAQTRVRYNDILVDQLDVALALPVLSQDSLDVRLHALHLRAQMDRLDASFEANIKGNLDSVFAENMQLVFRDKKLFSGDVAVYHPTQLDELYVAANCNDLYCNNALLQDLLSQLQMKPVVLPDVISNLGHVHYKGDVRGRLEHLYLHGLFSTALGAVNITGDLKSDTTLQDFDFCGHVSTMNFQLGKMLNNSDLGAVKFHAHMDIEVDSMAFRQCKADMKIDQIEYRGYTYEDIQFDGEVTTEQMNGYLNIKDENVQLTLEGLADWSKKDTRLDITARLEDLRPEAIHLIEAYPEMAISAMAYVNLYTSGELDQVLDNLTGYIIIDTLDVRNGEKLVVMEQMKVLVDSDKERKQTNHQLRIQSDYLTANISGDFQYQTLPATIQGFLHQYLPAIVEKPKKQNKQPNNVGFYAYFRELEKITEALDMDVHFPSYPTVKGYINEEYNSLGLQAYIPKIRTSTAQMEDLTIEMNNELDALDLSVYVFNRLPKENPTAAKIGDVKAHMNLTARENELDMTISLDNTDSIRNAGEIQVGALLQQYNNKPQANIHIQPTEIVLNDSIWTINESDIIYTAAEKKMDIRSFSINTDFQRIAVDGIASTDPNDSIEVELQNIDLQYLLGYTEASKAISVQGPLSGWAKIYGLFAQPMIEANALLPNAGLNGTYLGDVVATAYLDREAKAIIINGEAIDSTNHKVVDVQGKVIPATKWWGLDIQCDSVDISLIDFWTNKIFSNPQGRAYGNLSVFGQNRQTWVTAAVFGKDAQVTIPQLGTTFYFSDSVLMDSTSIRIPHATAYDAEGNKGILSGIITHENFLNMRYDINASVENMLAMNLPYEPQSMFYGKVYGSGDLHIYGDDFECNIDVDARTEANTQFFLSVTTATTATSSSFIDFVQPDTTSQTLLRLLQTPKKKKKTTIERGTRTKLSLQIEATPTAEINIKMGGDDGIRGRGEGNIQLSYDDSSGEVQMLGTYTLQLGLFTFTLGNIVRRNFTIAEGSRMMWSGDPLSPTVDITGRYQTTASLRDLFGTEISQVATNRTSVPVNCVLHMTDLLFNPVLKFAIELPQSDESVQSQINSIINTDEMLMRQVIYLLVFNRFYTPDYLQSTQTVGLNETYSLLSSTITGQINSWLSKLTDIFTMGFNFRTDGEGETASQEYEANFQIRPINQLIINGNFGYRYNDLSNRPFFGDLDIEYLLTPNGKLRAKAYTHTVDKYSLRQANTVQGVGLVFKHDFNWKLRPKKNRTQEVAEEPQKEEIIQPKDTSSTPIENP